MFVCNSSLVFDNFSVFTYLIVPVWVCAPESFCPCLLCLCMTSLHSGQSQTLAIKMQKWQIKLTTPSHTYPNLFRNWNWREITLGERAHNSAHMFSPHVSDIWKNKKEGKGWKWTFHLKINALLHCHMAVQWEDRYYMNTWTGGRIGNFFTFFSIDFLESE